MNTKKAIQRLNHIDWGNIGKNGHKNDMEFGIVFIKRMAIFCKKNTITPSLPFTTDLPAMFGKKIIDSRLLEQCHPNVKKIIKNPSFSTAIVDYYLRACMLGEEKQKYRDCVAVYEPIIFLFERGGNFVYQERGMLFLNSGLIPLTNWFENFCQM